MIQFYWFSGIADNSKDLENTRVKDITVKCTLTATESLLFSLGNVENGNDLETYDINDCQ